MSMSRLTAAALGVGAVGLALVGVGAGATFTDATNSTQTIQAGTLNMTLSTNAPGATTSTDGKSVTLADASPVGSTFKTDAVTFEITNAGTLTANEIWLNGSDTNGGSAADQALLAQTNVCIYSPYIDSSNPGGVVFDGLLSRFENGGQQVTGPVAPGQHDHYTAEFYAGNVTTKCGAETSPDLTNDAESGSITPTVTLHYNA